MSKSRMDSVRGFLVYVSRSYRNMTTYLKGVHLTLDNWRLYRGEEGRRMRVESLKMAEVEGVGKDRGGVKIHTGNSISPPKMLFT